MKYSMMVAAIQFVNIQAAKLVLAINKLKTKRLCLIIGPKLKVMLGEFSPPDSGYYTVCDHIHGLIIVYNGWSLFH